MSDDLPFKAEYAKSGRAACKACKANISKDSLRVAKMVQSPHFDGKMPNWFHIACFFKKNVVTSQGDIDGFDNLRWDDQQSLKQRIAGGGGAVGGSVAAPKGKMADKVHTRADLEVEYSKSGRAKCRGCFENIPKDVVRIAKMEDPDSDEYYSHGQPIARWHHVDCFVDNRESLNVSEDVSADMLTGFKSLKKVDQEMLFSKLGGGDKKPAVKATKGKKRKADEDEDEVDGGAPLKKVKSPAEAKEEKALKSQSEFIWKIRDKLRQNVSNNGLKELLEESSQDVPSGESRLLDRASDMLAFGALERCSTCRVGQFVLRGDLYACTGNLTEWTKCQETTVDPKRFPPTIPPSMQSIEYLKEFKFKAKKRIFPKLTAMATSDGLASATQSARSSDLPLKDLTISIIGPIKGMAGFEKRIGELGGKVTTKISEDLFCVISTPAQVEKMSKKMQAVEAAGVPVVGTDFVEDAAAGCPELKINSHKLATWGLKKHLTKSGGAVKSVGKRSAGADAPDGGAAKKMKISVKGGAAVDPASGMEDSCHVLEDKGSIFSATLGMVDIQRGTNSFYKLQVLESDKGSRYFVFRAWGRVGTTIGGDKTETYHSRQNAMAQFKTLYQEKTGNSWENRKSFVKVVGKFYPLDIDYGQDDEDLQKLKLKVNPGSKSTLDKPIQDLVQLLFDIESMQNALIEFEIDMKKMPLGKLSKRQIESAYSVLNEALKELEGAKNATRLLDASNRFYTLIPHDFGMQKPPLLDNTELIQTKCTMLDSLLEIEVAYSLLKQGGGDAAADPIDLNYQKLKTDMEVLSHDHTEFVMIKDFMANTHASTHNQYELELLEVFKVDRHGEGDRYDEFKSDHNRMLLWHGSRTTNFCGILSQGLRIAPPEAPVTGYMFGKGIYFADMVSKSANYCRTTPGNSVGLMLLCEVALGDMHELTAASYVKKLPSGKLSTKGIGRTAPDATGNKTLDNGCVVPMGKGCNGYKGSTSLLYNEFIVYDVSQISMKYLLKVDFKYKSRGWF